MSMTDPVADMLTRVRNASRAGHRKVDIPSSKMKREVARILKERGFVHNYAYVDDGLQGYLRLYLKYSEDEESAIQGLHHVVQEKAAQIEALQRENHDLSERLGELESRLQHLQERWPTPEPGTP